MTDYRYWTDEEASLLKSKWEESAVRGLSKTLGRSEKSISEKARKMGLKPKKVHVPWTKEADRILAEKWPYFSGSEVADILEKEGFKYSRAATIARAVRRGLKKSSDEVKQYRTPTIRRFSFEDLPA